ncbi:hypothetical protein BFG52_03890 [Acinetobacter larvae]|uniref:Uncharacterized protein n=2 Tax=Acinetobacter larvae TaxID=1789224 RepID=A0A1B2LX99_9GAMM|nr:hypothetical protein BFG52_03890 [Acinetobacter larvae]
MIVLILVGCVTGGKDETSNTTPNNIGQLRSISIAKRDAYLKCVKDASMQYAKSTSTPNDVAQAAIGKCDSNLASVELAFFNQVSAVGKGSMIDLDIKLSKEAAVELKEQAYRDAIRFVIEDRMQSSN